MNLLVQTPKLEIDEGTSNICCAGIISPELDAIEGNRQKQLATLECSIVCFLGVVIHTKNITEQQYSLLILFDGQVSSRSDASKIPTSATHPCSKIGPSMACISPHVASLQKPKDHGFILHVLSGWTLLFRVRIATRTPA